MTAVQLEKGHAIYKEICSINGHIIIKIRI